MLRVRSVGTMLAFALCCCAEPSPSLSAEEADPLLRFERLLAVSSANPVVSTPPEEAEKIADLRTLTLSPGKSGIKHDGGLVMLAWISYDEHGNPTLAVERSWEPPSGKPVAQVVERMNLGEIRRVWFPENRTIVDYQLRGFVRDAS